MREKWGTEFPFRVSSEVGSGHVLFLGHAKRKFLILQNYVLYLNSG